jgi:anti-sigma factor RsiW
LVEHLTQRQFEGYRLRRLGVEELLSVCDHLGACEACRRRLEGAGEGDTTFFALRSELFGGPAESFSTHAAREHLTAEQTAAYVDGTLSGEGLQTADDHLSSCDHCAFGVEDLRAFRAEVAPSLEREYRPAAVAPPPAAPSPAEGRWRRAFASPPDLFRASPVPAFGAALAVILLAVFGWLTWRTARQGEPRQEVVVTPSAQPAPAVVAPTPPEPAPSPTQPEPAPAVAQLDGGGGRLTLDREGRLSGADALPPAYREMLRVALTGRRIERSPQLKGLSRPGSSLMSSEAGAASSPCSTPSGACC